MRHKLMTERGYTPYCGNDSCMRRSTFNGSQFQCSCGWVSKYDCEFIDRYKTFRGELE